jgi:hypothetical protein
VRTLAPRRLGTLRLSAASALVQDAGRLWTVADDQLELHCYADDGRWLGQWPLLDGVLPAEPAARKAAKPDFEAMALLPDGALLVLGSGSTAQRMAGVLCRVGRPPQRIDAGDLYRQLAGRLAELNIEGALVRNGQLLLAQRGNGAAGVNALLALDLAAALADLAQGRLAASSLRTVTPIELGSLQGVPLGLTDLALAADGRLFFSAAAEASASTYHDGACAGSLIGWLDEQARVVQCWALPAPLKIEGLSFADNGNLLLVADADDPLLPAPLLCIDAVALSQPQ